MFKKLFEVTPREGMIGAWIAVRSDWRAVQVMIPWFWGRVGFQYHRPFTFYYVSEWLESTFGYE